MNQLTTLCPHCGQPLFEMNINKTHYPIVCDNIKCLKYRQPQGYRKISPAIELPSTPDPEPKSNRLLRPSYHTYLEQRQINYRILRDLGIEPTVAAGLTSNKQTREQERLARGKVKRGA